ncbi:erythrocyte membrane protein 1, PfEMP1, putative [Plasmodium sp.]|nr:erythrocyte membrane protein 1, PfEMP1, putative [Plasmodium sp.]
MAPASGGGGTKDESAKDVLDEIGEKVHEKVKVDAKEYISKLKGNLSLANVSRGKTLSGNDPCKLVDEYRNKSDANRDRNPCGTGKKVPRFSNSVSGQCTNSKNKGNLEKIPTSTTTDTLLAEVCMAAKYEGESIKNYHDEHQKSNKDSNICTVLARSFADIGDIIRGKDLYFGNKKESARRQQLNKNLKKYFKNIYKELIKKESNSKTSVEAKKRYGTDTTNYYQLREDWWTANRETVWKAITCSAGGTDDYYKKSGNRELKFTSGYCGRKEENVPTNLDYVPQYLRWYDEWTDDFCRLKKIKLDNVKNACRDEKKGKYCSYNGYDCTKTNRSENFCVWSSECTKCLVECKLYELWIGNQGKEFEKQKEKYENEKNGNTSQDDSTNNNIHNKYNKDFYKLLEEKGYKTVKQFINLLNKGRYCKKKKTDEEDINFYNTGNKGIFSRSKYCQVCPYCGVDCSTGTCKEKGKDDNCGKKVNYLAPLGSTSKEITVLYSGDEEGVITEELKDFCREPNNDKDKNYKKWICYNKNREDNNCEMISSSYKNTKVSNVMLSVECFYWWVQNLLINTIKWEYELKDCINNTYGTDCHNECNNNCQCYQKWIKRKEHEWKELKKIFGNKNGMSDNYYNELSRIFDRFLYPVIYKLEKEEEDGKWDQFTEDLKKKIEASQKNKGTENSEDGIKVLLDHLKENATICKDNNTNEACPSTMNRKPNPCGDESADKSGDKSGAKHATVKQIAQYYKRKAHAQLEEGGDSRSALRGDASKGKYKQGGDPSDFTELCNINESHSNRNPQFSEEPCGGKGTGEDINTRFVVGTVWKPDKTQIRPGHEDIIMPPRRRHICTSNLEYLQTTDRELDGTLGADKINHSFLGDVLLSAKYEAKNIKQMYKENNNLDAEKEPEDPKHQETICRAIRYSFADLGDIIRGRDIWDKEKGMEYAKGHLKTVFGNIYNSLKKKHLSVAEKYSKDDPDHIKLREDWWEANRDQVWKAMKCHIENLKDKSEPQSTLSDYCGFSDHTPLDDYIPQRLRWMTELAEWYCKAQKKAYDDCDGCWDNDKPRGKECTGDPTKCKEYNSKIEKLKEQWIQLRKEYSNLYADAQIAAFNDSRDNYKVKEKDKPVFNFLYDLHVENGGTVGPLGTPDDEDSNRASTKSNTMYYNVGSYLYDAWDYINCKNKKEFCNTGTKFIEKPAEEAVVDDEENPPPPEATPAAPEGDDKEVCEIVDQLIGNNDGNEKIEDCNVKETINQPYPGWECGEKKQNLVSGNGECMPPRRRKLCLYFLASKKAKEKIETREDLRTAFIKSAAAETFFAWHYYKKKNGKGATKLDEELKKGKIPPEFLRSMFYTYGDYRDLCLDSDISKKEGIVKNAKENIDAYFNKYTDPNRTKWWTDNAKHIWEAMLCALEKIADKKNTLTNKPEYKTPPEDFASRPQFLRWYIEWSDEFCRERQKKENEVNINCTNNYDGCNDKDVKCGKACKTYKNYITDKKKEYNSQKKKFEDDRSKGLSGYDGYTNRKASEYLKEKCLDGSCSCMDKVTSITDYWTKPFETYDNTQLKNRCECQLQPPPEEQPTETPLSCVEKVAEKLRKEAEVNAKTYDPKLKGEVKNFNNGCKKIKKENGAPNGDDCEFKKTYENSVNKIYNECKDNRMERFKIGKKWNSKYIGTIRKDLYIPPRREYMCINHLKQIYTHTATDSSTLLKIIQEAAQHEGDDIIRKLLEQNSCDEHRICDAMKYSFADLGDIIRGRDILSNDKDQVRIQAKLKTFFLNLYPKLKSSNRKKYENDLRNLYELRSDWWDTNRKDIWKAMTCNAPDNAKLNKRNEEPYGIRTGDTYLSTMENCGHDKDPPDYDYIPQPFRWMQEWSESFCKLLNEEIKNFQKECKDCKNNNITCEGDKDGQKCKKCKEQCDKYTQTIHEWEKQFDKYKETYNYLYNNNSKTDNNYNNKYVNKFLNKLKDECEELKTADKYLHDASHCTKYKFTNHSDKKNNDNYAFKNPPKNFEQACECEEPDPLDHCPHTEDNNVACTKLSIRDECGKKYYNNDLDSWDSTNVEDFTRKNKGVLVPPRRRYLCLRNITSNVSALRTKKDFKKKLMEAAFNEAYFLSEKYDNVKEKAFPAMKYSFYDYGDIVKGTDLISTINLIDLNKKLNDLFKTDDTNNVCKNRDKWWNENKTRVWHAMVCGYQKRNGYKPLNASWCTLPTEDEKTHQFMRWFREWTESFCFHRKKLYDIMVTKCKEAECDDITGRLNIVECTQACKKYENYVLQKKQEYFSQKEKYDNDFKDLNDKKDAPDYFRTTFFSTNYDCLHDNFNDNGKWENPYESLGDNTLKGKCQCKKTKSKTVPVPDVHPPDKEETPPVRPPVPDTRPAPSPLPPQADEPFNRDILEKTIPFGIAFALGSIAFLFLKKKTQAPVDLFSVINIPKGDYDIPTLKSSNRYIPYASDRYKGKTYIYMEGDSSGDEKYAFMSDTTDITSSESEYEELDINDIYVPGSPKYKTLIEVVLEPSKRDIQSDDIPHSNKFTDDEWNQLKHDFISNMLQNQPKDVPNDYKSGKVPLNTQPNTLYFDKPEEKPFITSIHDRNLYSGEEYNYNVNMVNNDDIPINRDNNVYSGIDLINDSLNNNKVDIYDEVLKRKENELFGTNHPKHTNTHNVTKSSNSDPIDNQLNLFHTWLDRHRDMCEQWNNKEEVLDKLKEEWNKDNNSGNIPNDSNKTLNTDVSIQIHMDNPKPINQFNNMDTILEDVDKYNEPYYDVQDDIYYDVNDYDASTVDSNNMDVPSKVQIEMDVNTKLVKEKYPIADVWDI